MRQRAGPSVAPAVPAIALILPLVIRSVNDHLDTLELCLRLSGLHPPRNCYPSAFFEARNKAIVRLVG